MDATCGSRPNCPIEMSFDLDEALTLPQDIPSPQTSAVSSSLIILGMPTVVAAAMSFDLDEALTLPQDIPSPQTSAVSSSLIILGMPTVVAAAAADMCSVCMEAFQPGESGWQVPCGHVYHQACIAAWSVHNNSCPNCRCKIFQQN